MTKQQDNPHRPVWRAVIVVTLAAAVFGVAFYYFDGLSLIDELFGTTFASDGPAVIASSEAEDVIQLPDTMTEDFALRMWQEQIDSQENINRLVSGEITSIVVDGLHESDSEDEDLVVYDISAKYMDGTWAPGVMAMRRFGEYWYFSYVEGTRDIATAGFADTTNADDDSPPESPLPDIEDVDVPLLNTILKQQQESAQVLDEYAAGAVYSVKVTDITRSLGTATLAIEMEENHELTQGEIIAVSKEVGGTTLWFIARFTRFTTD